MSGYRKALVAVLGASLTALAGTLPPDTPVWRWVTAAVALGTAVGVWGASNAPTRPTNRSELKAQLKRDGAQ